MYVCVPLTTVSVTSLVEERERGDPLLLIVCLLREGMRGKGLAGLASGLSGEEEREKREGEKHRERFLASICRERGGGGGGGGSK